MPEYIDKIAWMKIENKKQLKVRTRGKEHFHNPGGQRRPGETDKQTLIRKIKNELCIDLKPETIKYFNTYKAQADGKPLGIEVRIAFYTADYIGEIKPVNDMDAITWMDYSDMDKMDPIGKIIISDLKAKGLVN